MRAAWLLLLAGCWTGTTEPPPVTPAPVAAAAPLRLRVTLERTYCMGACPVYSVTVHGDGRLEYNGVDNVAVTGPKQSHVSRAEVERLSRLVDRAQFFERNETGELPTPAPCTTVNGMTTCSYSAHYCSDTSHAKLTVTKRGRTHMIDNDHCDEKPAIDDLEAEIAELVRMWIDANP
jgi:hypothetical protein